MTTQEPDTNESFELDFAQEENKTVRAIGDFLDEIMITQGVIYPLRAGNTQTKGLVILYNLNEVKLEAVPAVFNEIALGGSNYQVRDRFHVSLDTDMSRDGIDKFITLMSGYEHINKRDRIELESLWFRIKTEIEFYYQFYDKRYYSILTAFVIGTYFHDMFSAFPYLWLNGFKKSGKTQLGNLLSNLSYCGISAATMTRSSLFRMIQLHSPTLFLDEMEQFNNPREMQDYRSLLNAGYKRLGSDVYLTNKETMDLERHKSYCPKILASINELEDVLSSRTIPIPCRRSTNLKFNTADREPSPDKFRDIRDDLYIARLLHSFQVYEKYNEISSQNYLEVCILSSQSSQTSQTSQNNPQKREESELSEECEAFLHTPEHYFDGRFWDMVKGLIVVTEIFASEEEKTQVMDIIWKINKTLIDDEQLNEEFTLLFVLKDVYEKELSTERHENSVDLWIELKELAIKFKERIGWEKCSSRRISRNMKQLGFEQKKRLAGKGNVCVLIEYDVLNYKLQSLNIKIESLKDQQNTLELDYETIIGKITEMQNQDCHFKIIAKELPEVTGLDSKLQILQKQGLIFMSKNNWRVVK